MLVVTLSGELDASVSDEFGILLQEVAGCREAAEIMMDLSGIAFIDAHGAAMIAAAEVEARARGKALRIAGLHAIPARVFTVLGLDYLLARPLVASIDGDER